MLRTKPNLAESRPERVATLNAVVEAAKSNDVGAEAPEIEPQLSPEAVERLRSLGYQG